MITEVLQAPILVVAVGGDYAEVDFTKDDKFLARLRRQRAESRFGLVEVTYGFDPMKVSLAISSQDIEKCLGHGLSSGHKHT
jgi:hypothetical protein